jgi:hypothetical protein
MRVRAEVQALPRRVAPFLWGGAAALAVVALALLGRGGIAEPPPEPEPVPSPTPAVAAGEWAELPSAPIMTPGEHRGVWTGAELVVAGGQSELVAYDARSERWRDLAPAPIAFGHDPQLTWTGRELLVWGGHLIEGRQTEIAAYNPRIDRWRGGADLPGRLRSLMVRVWAGDRLLVWDRTRGLSYDPARDTWSEVARIPVGWHDAQAVWTGEQVILWGARMGGPVPFALSYDPAEDVWTQVLRPWMHQPDEAAGVWTGDELLLWGRPRLIDGPDGPPTGIVYRPGAPSWRWLPDAGLDSPPGGLQAALTDHGVVFYGGHPTRVSLLFDGTWWELPPGGGARLNPVLAWTGTELLVWGGYTSRGPAVDLVAWRPSQP